MEINKYMYTITGSITRRQTSHNLRLSVVDDPAEQCSCVTRVKFVPANDGKLGSDRDHRDVHNCHLTYS